MQITCRDITLVRCARRLRVAAALITCSPFLVVVSNSYEGFALEPRNPTMETTRKLKNGVWGGESIIVEVTDSGATITYDCADGRIEHSIKIDDNGSFNVTGTHTRHIGGPVRSDEKPDRKRARYRGRVQDTSMTLTVTLTDTNESVGSFSLTYGERPELKRCF